MNRPLPSPRTPGQADLPWPTSPAMAKQHTAFEAFHAANPDVYAWLVKEARVLKEAGNDHFGMKALFEALRYSRARRGRTTKAEPFVLNNNYTAFYARLVMQREPDLQGFFATRSSKADREVRA